MTDEELNAIEQRANAALPGPWEWDDTEHSNSMRLIAGDVMCRQILKAPKTGYGIFVAYWPAPAEADFIANARADVPALIAEVRRLKAELAEMVERFRNVEGE